MSLPSRHTQHVSKMRAAEAKQVHKFRSDSQGKLKGVHAAAKTCDIPPYWENRVPHTSSVPVNSAVETACASTRDRLPLRPPTVTKTISCQVSPSLNRIHLSTVNLWMGGGGGGVASCDQDHLKSDAKDQKGTEKYKRMNGAVSQICFRIRT